MALDKSSFDLLIMDKFDAKKSFGHVKLCSTGISFYAVPGFDIGQKVVVYLSKDRSVIVFHHHQDGFALCKAGSAGTGRMIKCREVIEQIYAAGFSVPQEVEVYKDDNGLFYVRLIEKRDINR